MKKKLALLAYRRLELMQTIESQRMEISHIALTLQKPLAVADAGIKVAGFIYNHPALVTGTMTALLTWRRHGLVGLAKHGWRLLFLYPSAIFLGLKYLATPSCTPDEDRKSDIW